MLADRGFSSFATLAPLRARGVAAVRRLHQFRKLDWRAGQRLGNRDRLVTWQKGALQGKLWTSEHWAQVPAELRVRLVESIVAVPGFRTHKLVLVTTLLDAQTYSAEALGQLYFRRWAVELCFRDIKTTLGLAVLRCQRPALVRKEIVRHAPGLQSDPRPAAGQRAQLSGARATPLLQRHGGCAAAMAGAIRGQSRSSAPGPASARDVLSNGGRRPAPGASGSE